MKDKRPRTQGPEPSAARLGPRGFSVGVVVSLGGGFVLNFTYVCSVEVGYDEYCC